jgi:hypothetical protein
LRLAAKLFDASGKEITHHNLQDKSHWCTDGESMEQSFVRRIGFSLGLEINPVKIYDPYVPDLVYSGSNKLADLKSQHSPFFKAGDFFNIDPTFAVVFNLKDKSRYEQHYPDIDIIYYIDWVAVSADINGKIYKVQPLHGVYRISFGSLVNLLRFAPVHSYGQRRFDTKGNAKESYVLDIRHPSFDKLL